MISETTQTAPASAAAEAKATKKAARAPRRAPVAPQRAKSGNKATPAKKKAPKVAKKAKRAKTAPAARHGSKTETMLDLLRRPGGATSKELMEATGWQPHSVRGFLSGTVGKKMRLTVVSTKGENGERTYSVKA